jgi:hypothetical protein
MRFKTLRTTIEDSLKGYFSKGVPKVFWWVKETMEVTCSIPRSGLL